MLWRLVRPGNTDCAPLHIDRWFWEISEKPYIPNYPHQRLNVWVAIDTVPEKNGLMVVPYSQHKKDWQYNCELRNGLKKPIISENLEKIDCKLIPSKPGDVILFHHDLLHGGSPNLADKTRVSLEFTLFVPIAA